jgi:hypothetical protein
VTLADLRGHAVRSALAVRAANVSAANEINGAGPSHTVTIPVRSAFSGTLTAKPFGLVESTVSTKHLVGKDPGAFNADNPQESETVAKFTVNVPAGTKVARFSTFDADYSSGTDLDMHVYTAGTANEVGNSTGGSAEEGVTVPAGSYDIYVVQFALPAAVTENDVKLHTFIVGPTATGNLTVTPASQPTTAGAAKSVTATWSGLTPGKYYLGIVEFGNGSTPQDRTIIQVRA